MNAKDKQLLIQIHNELQLERQCADLLARALTQGGLDLQFEAMTNYEILRNGFQYSQQIKQSVAQTKPKAKRTRRSPNHPTMGYYFGGKEFGFNCEPFQPNQDEDKED